MAQIVRQRLGGAASVWGLRAASAAVGKISGRGGAAARGLRPARRLLSSGTGGDPSAPPPGGDSAAAGAAEDAGEAATLRTEVAELKDRLLRSLAEGENSRRRFAREAETAKNSAVGAMAKSLVEVADVLELCLTHVGAVAGADSNDSAPPSPEGSSAIRSHTRSEAPPPSPELVNFARITYGSIDACLKRLLKVFSDVGVKPFRPGPGDPFTPTEHEAAATVPVEDTAMRRRIEAALTTGYKQDGRVIRPAKVSIYN